MYFIISFDILSGNPAVENSFKQELKSQLEGLYWAKPLSNMMVVRCEDDQIRRNMYNYLHHYSQQNPNTIRFIITPLINSGRVIGLTAADLWEHLNNITDSEFNSFDGGFF